MSQCERCPQQGDCPMEKINKVLTLLSELGANPIEALDVLVRTGIVPAEVASLFLTENLSIAIMMAEGLDMEDQHRYSA